MKELLIRIFEAIGLAHWVEIVTENPRCTYYFGPFIWKSAAESEKMGYIEDIQSEGARIVSVQVKRCQPGNLTIFEEKGESQPFQGMATLSGSLS
jgi:hypothetical protein